MRRPPRARVKLLPDETSGCRFYDALLRLTRERVPCVGHAAPDYAERAPL